MFVSKIKKVQNQILLELVKFTGQVELVRDAFTDQNQLLVNYFYYTNLTDDNFCAQEELREEEKTDFVDMKRKSGKEWKGVTLENGRGKYI